MNASRESTPTWPVRRIPMRLASSSPSRVVHPRCTPVDRDLLGADGCARRAVTAGLAQGPFEERLEGSGGRGAEIARPTLYLDHRRPIDHLRNPAVSRTPSRTSHLAQPPEHAATYAIPTKTRPDVSRKHLAEDGSHASEVAPSPFHFDCFGTPTSSREEGTTAWCRPLPPAAPACAATPSWRLPAR